MRELDELLLRYLEQRYEHAPAADKDIFRALLELPDPELTGYLLHKQSPAADWVHVIEQLLYRTQA